jgi:hypothetical protein
MIATALQQPFNEQNKNRQTTGKIMSEVSKGVLALRLHGNKPVKIVVKGDVFYFKKLTLSAEEAVKRIIQSHQDPTLKPPKDLPEGATDEQREEYMREFDDYTDRSQVAFRRLTCDLIKFLLTDENGKPFFAEEDDIYDLVNNVYAENFFEAYSKFRGGLEGGTAEAEKRFQG